MVLFCIATKAPAEILQIKSEARPCSVWSIYAWENTNFRAIYFLANAGKKMAKRAQYRLVALAEDVSIESQCRFRQKRSTVHMLFSLRQVEGKTIDQNQEIYVIIAHFRKSFDTVDRPVL